MYKQHLTSIKQIPAAIKKIEWKKGTKNLDIGGGRYNLATEYLKKNGVKNIIFDPYSRSLQENIKVPREIPYDSATILNVLNVIPSMSQRIYVLILAKKFVKQNGHIYISVYEGNHSEKERVSKKQTWQANKKINSYITEIQSIFKNVQLKSSGSFKYIEIIND